MKLKDITEASPGRRSRGRARQADARMKSWAKRWMADVSDEVEKLNPKKAVTAIYFDGAKNNYFVKRFLIKHNTAKFNFITEHKDSFLELVSTDWRPQVELVFVKEKGKDRQTKIINLEEFIAIKGVKAKGNRLSSKKIKEINLLEPLAYTEPVEIEEEIRGRSEPKLWNFYADISLGAIHTNNVNSVSKTRTQMSSDSVIGFNTAKHDRTLSGSLGLTATRSIGEASSFMINLSQTESEQYQETGDDYESYGLTLALDTSVGNQSLSPYLMLSKTDYQDDADSFSFMYGIGGYFSVGERNSFSYGYSYSDSKGNHNSSDTTANETNAIGYGFALGHDFIFNELISTSIGLGYSDSDAKVDAGNDYETYDFSFGLNFAFPWALISVSSAHSFSDYKRQDTSIDSNIIRSDYSDTFSFSITKAVGDVFPFLDPNKLINLSFSYDKRIDWYDSCNGDHRVYVSIDDGGWPPEGPGTPAPGVGAPAPPGGEAEGPGWPGPGVRTVQSSPSAGPEPPRWSRSPESRR